MGGGGNEGGVGAGGEGLKGKEVGVCRLAERLGFCRCKRGEGKSGETGEVFAGCRVVGGGEGMRGGGGEVGLKELIESVTHSWEFVREKTVPLCSKQRELS